MSCAVNHTAAVDLCCGVAVCNDNSSEQLRPRPSSVRSTAPRHEHCRSKKTQNMLLARLTW